MSKQEVILCEGLANSLTHAIEKCPHDKLFILTDEHTHRLCRPHLDGIPALEEAEEIIIGAEDVHKNMETLAAVWQALSENKEIEQVRNKSTRNAIFLTVLFIFGGMLYRVAQGDLLSVDSSSFLIFLILNVLCLEFGIKKATVDRLFKRNGR